MANYMFVDTDTVDSTETYVGRCSGCLQKVGMCCSDMEDIKFCPMCGVEVTAALE